MHADPAAIPTPYHKKRYLAFLLIAIFSLSFPFVRLDGNHMFLLSFSKMEFHLLGTIYDMQELYLIPLMLIMFFVFIFLVTSIGGRVWCGWGCPQTMFRVIYRDLIQTTILGLRKWKIKNKKLKLDKPVDKLKYVAGILMYVPLALLASANVMWFFVSPYEFFDWMFNNPLQHQLLLGWWLGLGLFLVVDICFVAEYFCIYFCPYARIQSVLFDADTPIVVYDDKRGDNSDGSRGGRNLEGKKDNSGDCTGCDACVRVCPTGIDIREGLQLECISCLECVDACAPVMARLGKENLIGWRSEKALEGKPSKVLRPRLFIYALLLVVMSGALIYSGTHRESLLMNVNRATGLYSIKEDGQRVENHYIVMITNTDEAPHEFELEIQGLEGVEMIRPKRTFKIQPHSRAKKVMVLSTKSLLVDDPTRNTSLPFKLIAKSVNDPEKLNASRQTVFIFPPSKDVKMVDVRTSGRSEANVYN